MENVMDGSRGVPGNAPPPEARTLVRVATRFEARPSGLAELHTACERLFDAAQAAGAPVRRADKFPVVTAAAEIAANIILHACVDTPDSEVVLVLCRTPHTVEVSFEDPGVTFVEAGTGHGLTIARASVHTVEYTRTEGINRWLLIRQTGLGQSEDGAFL